MNDPADMPWIDIAMRRAADVMGYLGSRSQLRQVLREEGVALEEAFLVIEAARLLHSYRSKP